MEKQIADLQEQNAAYRVLLAAKLNEQKKKFARNQQQLTRA